MSRRDPETYFVIAIVTLLVLVCLAILGVIAFNAHSTGYL